MNAPTIEPEVLPPEVDSQMLAVVTSSGLPAESAQSLQSAFLPAFAEARGILIRSRSIEVKDASQVLEIKLARACRLALRTVRTGADNLRKGLKEDGLRRGKAIDGFYNILVHMIDSEETRLAEQEKFVERAEAARVSALETERSKALAAYGLTLTGLGVMADATWAQLLENTRLGHEAKQAAARKAEADRIAAENARLMEEARIREENERLKKEAEAREAAAKVEREKAAAAAAKAKADADAALAEERRKAEEIAAKERARVAEEQRLAAEKARKEKEAIEAKAKVEREKTEAAARLEQERLAAIAEQERIAREKAEAELRAAREAEEVRKQQEAEVERKAALAPDREKLLAVANNIRWLELPSLLSDEANDVAYLLKSKLEKLAAWVEQEAKVL